ncbi:ion transporter [Marinococcus halotolerans]|uniref:ion transporter n=1 Tax=Marinococcus halotolerans TaxID=301092 RepID=UPI0003B641D8|nr:ion transporter [Marinococcus halotolerans]
MSEISTFTRFRQRLAVILDQPAFTAVVTTLILFNALLVGLETSEALYSRYENTFSVLNYILLWLFTIEVIIRFLGVFPFYHFFKSPWNWFDFFIVAAGHIFAGSAFITVLRILRVLRVLRAITVVPSLRRLVDALLRTIPSLGNIMILMSIIFYVYAVIGTMLYRDTAPEYFGDIFQSLLTLFQVVTLESWASAVMRPIAETNPLSWIYFVSFVLVGTFVVFNLFVGVIVSNVEKAEAEESEDKLQKQLDHMESELSDIKQLLKDKQKD